MQMAKAIFEAKLKLPSLMLTIRGSQAYSPMQSPMKASMNGVAPANGSNMFMEEKGAGVDKSDLALDDDHDPMTVVDELQLEVHTLQRRVHMLSSALRLSIVVLGASVVSSICSRMQRTPAVKFVSNHILQQSHPHFENKLTANYQPVS